MLSNSIWRALPPSCTRTLGQAARTGNKVRAMPGTVPATSIATVTPPARRWTSTSPGPTPDAARTDRRPLPNDGESASRWSGGAVFGVGLTAGLLGWGIASMSTGRSEKGAWRLDSLKQYPRYASKKEMEIVSMSQQDSMNRYWQDVVSADSILPTFDLTQRARLSKRSATSSAPRSKISSRRTQTTCTRMATRSGRRQIPRDSPWLWRTRGRQSR